MKFELLIRKVGCRGCGASGKQSDLLEGDSFECPDCRGAKTHRAMFAVSDEPCDAGMGGTACKAGVLVYTEDAYVLGKDFLGRETRRLINAGAKYMGCPFCFGTGKKHYLAEKDNCGECSGDGVLAESSWEKRLFGGEVLRTRTRKCPSCQGAKFSWLAGEAFTRTQIERSNV